MPAYIGSQLALELSNILSKYCAFFSTTTLNEGSLPGTFTYLLNKVHKGGSAFSPAKRMIDQITYLAQIVLILSHIIEIESCEQIPLRLTSDHPFLASQMSIICKAPDARATVLAEEIFHAVAMLLSDGVFDVRDDKPRFSSRMTHFLFLWSDFGWSVYFDTVGDKDPAEVRRHLVHVKRGTPTNLKTNERKLLLRDGSGFTRKMYPDSFPLLNGGSYVPRCAAKVVRRVERWASRRQEFESTLYFDVQPSAEWRQYPVESLLGAFSHEGQQPQAARELVSPFEELGGYRKMQDMLWRTLSTPDDICDHQVLDRYHDPVKLGPDAAALLGWSDAAELILPSGWPYRVVVFLTRADPRLRWLAVLKAATYTTDARRRLMLRTPKCCDPCALSYVASQPGRWILVL